MSSYDSHVADVVMVVRGANFRADDLDKAFNGDAVTKNYNAECGSGFYLLKDIELAKKYAYERVKENGGEPWLNYYLLRLADMKAAVKSACFTELDARTLDYLGDNLAEQFPETCKFFGVSDVRPQDECHHCSEECDRNAQYIEALLSDHIDYNFDSVLLLYAVGDISEDEALADINTFLQETGFDIKLQILLRGDARSYIEFHDAKCLTKEGD